MYYECFNNNNNPLENLNKQLNRKLTNLNNFKSLDSLNSFNQVWFLDYINKKKTQENEYF